MRLFVILITCILLGEVGFAQSGFMGRFELVPPNEYSLQDGKRIPYSLFQNFQSIKTSQDAFNAYIAYSVNVMTPGYKQTQVLSMRTGDNIFTHSYINFDSGPTFQSNDPLHFALEGEHSMFTVLLPSGLEAYTKDGRFQLEDNGKLVTYAHGFTVLGETGAIYLSAPENVIVSKEGNIYDSSQLVDQFKIISFQKPSQLETASGTYFIPKNTQEFDLIERDYYIKQGYYEQSNVQKGVGTSLLMKWNYQGNTQAVKSIIKMHREAFKLGEIQ